MAVYRFGPFVLDVRERRLTRDGERLALTGKTVDVLILLVEAGGRLVERATFQTRLWPDTVVEERNLTVHIATLRKLLNNGGAVDYIETVPKAGYRLTVPVAVSDGAPGPAASPAPRSAPRLRPTVLAAGLLVVLAGGAWIGSDAVPHFGAKPELSAPTLVRLAVLPFATPGLADAEKFLGLGIADAIITQLGGTSRIAVRPTSTVKGFAGTEDPTAVGRQLDVQAVMEGLIQREGDRLRVTVQLVDVASGTTRWAEGFDRPISDIFDLQDAIAARVAGTLVPQLAAEARAGASPSQTSSPEAYLLQVQARVNLSRVERAPALRAVEQFRQAIALDPGYATAYAGLASAYVLLTRSEITRALSPAEGQRLVQDAAQQALALDGRMGEAHAALAAMKFAYEWDWDGAEAGYRQALAASPNSVEAAESYGWFLAARGRFDAALAVLEGARRNDPLRREIIEYIGLVRWMAGSGEGALATLSEATALDPEARRPYLRRMFVLDQLRRHDEAMAERVKWLALFKSQDLADLLLEIQQREGYPAAMTRWLIFLDRFDQPYEVAMQWMAVDEPDKALAALERCVSTKCSGAPFLRANPSFRPLAGDRRFEALALRVNLAAGN